MRPLVPTLLVALVAATALAQPAVLGPSLPLPGDLTPGEAGGVQMSPYIAAGGAGSLAVWVDHRAEFNSPLANQGGPDVFAIRLDAFGQPLDPVALRLPFAVGDKQYPKAAWNGSAWLVTWENQQPLGSSSFFRLILGARVAGDGTLLDATPIVIKDDFETTGSTSALASDGSSWVVVAQGTEADPGTVVAVRVDAGGNVVNPVGSTIAILSSAIGRPDLDYANGRYLLVYATGHVQGLRFSQSLIPLGTPFAIGTGSSSKARVATDGQDFLVAWENQDIGNCVRARRVTGATGAQSAVIQITTLSNGEFNWEPDVSWNGTQWHVAFRDSIDKVYRLARITAGLALLDPDGVALPVGTAPGAGRAVLAPVAGGVTVAFERQDLTQNWPGTILSTLVDDAMATTLPVTLSLSAPRQGSPAIAAGDDQYLVAFLAEKQDTLVVEVQRLDPFGDALDPEPIELATGNRFGQPSIAWNGQHYLVAWEDRKVVSFETDDVVLGMRVGPDGAVLDAAPRHLMDGGSPDVAAQGDVFLVASSHAPSDPQLRHPYARRIASDGTPLGAAVQLGGLFARYPRVAPLGDGWVVTWQRNFSHDNPNSVAHAALVAADGSASPNFVVDGAAGFGGAARPDVASNGGEALLVWMDDFTGLAGRRLLADGTLLGAFAIAPLPALPALPAVAWNGEDYLVTWQDYRAQVGLWDFRTDVYAARVTAGGVVLDNGGGFAVAAGDENELQPAIAGALGAELLTWVEFLPEAPYATLRVHVRRESPWQTEGGAVGGALGKPLLQGQGDLLAANPVAFHVTKALPLAPGLLILSTFPLNAPFYGGVLVPSPDILVPVSMDVAGELHLATTVPPGLPSAVPVFMQCWLYDASGPHGYTGSNAIGATVP